MIPLFAPATPFTPFAFYHGVIRDVRMLPLRDDRGGLFARINIAVRKKITGAGAVAPEGDGVLERLDLGPNLEPLTNPTRAILGVLPYPVSHPADLQGLPGISVEFSLGPPCQLTNFQRVVEFRRLTEASVTGPLPAGSGVFRPEGPGFYIRYLHADGVEESVVRAVSGLRTYRRILMSGGTALELRDPELGRQTPAGVAAAVAAGEVTATGRLSFQEVLDPEAIHEWVMEIFELTKRITEATNLEASEVGRWTNNRMAIAELLRSGLSRRARNIFERLWAALAVFDLGETTEALGRSFFAIRDRDLTRRLEAGDPSAEARKVVAKNLEYARKKLRATGLPRFAEHLESSVGQVKGCYRYAPAASPAWQF
ncbi:MAG: hypothetical protein JWO38_7174 [Gemmataceae bacterium]|nr:hypothetical protein [Gemmataceae bacterium]